MMASGVRVLLCLSSAMMSGATPPGFGGDPGCDKSSVLERKTSAPGDLDWPGSCLGLVQEETLSESTTEAVCREKCTAKDSCSVWQLNADSICYVSDPVNQTASCWGRENDTTFSAIAAERIQHGYVTVTQNLTNVYYPGLKNLGSYPNTSGRAAVTRCQRNCYSDIYCEKWFYVHPSTLNPIPDTVTPKTRGCHVFTKDTEIGNVETVDPVATGQIIEGEAVEHSCKEPPLDLKPLEEAAKGILAGIGMMLMIGSLACCVGAVCIVTAIWYLCCKSTPTEKRTRAVKVAPKKQKQAPQEVLQPLVPMPVVQQPMVAYVAAPTVSTPVTTATYQAVPQAAPAVYSAAPPMVQSIAAVPQVQSLAAVPQVQSIAAIPQAVPQAATMPQVLSMEQVPRM